MTQEIIGRVLKSYNSFFYVKAEDEIITCKLRGKFKKKEGIYPGDMVGLEKLPDGTGIVEKLYPRGSLMKRPLVANVDQAIITFAAAEPALNQLLLNRFLVLAEWSNLENIVICINKWDLAADNLDFIADYEKIGYPVIKVSAKTKVGIDTLKSRLEGHITVFAGASGVGKSSLLNAIDSDLKLETGEVSDKIKRGRHTTRVAALIPYGDGYIVDTPGFSAVDFSAMEKNELASCFPEFADFCSCRFSPCSHSHEPDCAVKAAVEQNKIMSERYAAYLNILEEIANRKKEYK